jgi:two-component system nitrate/nitrite response regulator NarL
MKSPIRVLLVDENPCFLAAARDFLRLQQNLNVVGVAGEARGMLEQIQQVDPEIILLDMNVGNHNGLDLIPVIKEAAPCAKIVILTILEEEPCRTAALQAGADAFIGKTDMSRRLPSVIAELSAASNRAG